MIYNNSEQFVIVSTYDKSLIRKINKKMAERPEIKLVKQSEGFAEYSLPKKWVKIRPPKQYSEEQRAKMKERMKNIRNKGR